MPALGGIIGYLALAAALLLPALCLWIMRRRGVLASRPLLLAGCVLAMLPTLVLQWVLV